MSWRGWALEGTILLLVRDLDALYAKFSSDLTARLRQLAFRRRGTSFYRQPTPPETNWIMVNVQTMLTPESRDFVLNYGIISPTLLGSVDGWLAPAPAPGKLPKRRGAQVEWRLSRGWDERPGYSVERWWRLTQETGSEEIRELAVEVTDAVAREALPRLQPLATDEGLRDYYLERLYEPDGWLAPIDLGRLISLLEHVGPVDRIASVRADAEVRMAENEERRWQSIAEFQPFVGDVARDLLQRNRRGPGRCEPS